MFYDLHCHILPGLDDGAFSLDESCMMAELAAEHRTRCIVCTPHTYPDSRCSPKMLMQAYSQTLRAIADAKICLQLALGQEIYFDTESADETFGLLKSGRLLTLNRSVYPLIELDPMIRSWDALRIVERITSIGLSPIVAHPERYAFAVEDTENLIRLKRAGARLQLNGGSLLGHFGRRAAYAAREMLEERMADFAASDAHSPHRRSPALDELHRFISEEISDGYADFLLTDNPRRVLENKAVMSY